MWEVFSDPIDTEVWRRRALDDSFYRRATRNLHRRSKMQEDKELTEEKFRLPRRPAACAANQKLADFAGPSVLNHSVVVPVLTSSHK